MNYTAFSLVLTTILFAFSAGAQPVYPTPIAGVYTANIQILDVPLDPQGVAETDPTLSVAMVDEFDNELACYSINESSTATLNGLTVSFAYTVPAPLPGTHRVQANAYAFPDASCGSPSSPPSVRSAFHFFGTVLAPILQGAMGWIVGLWA